MNVEIGAEATLFPEKEYISGIFVAVHGWVFLAVRTTNLSDRKNDSPCKKLPGLIVKNINRKSKQKNTNTEEKLRLVIVVDVLLNFFLFGLLVC